MNDENFVLGYLSDGNGGNLEADVKAIERYIKKAITTTDIVMSIQLHESPLLAAEGFEAVAGNKDQTGDVVMGEDGSSSSGRKEGNENSIDIDDDDNDDDDGVIIKASSKKDRYANLAQCLRAAGEIWGRLWSYFVLTFSSENDMGER